MQGVAYETEPGYGLTATATTSGSHSLEHAIFGSSQSAEMSHLDSFFAGTGWTREDVLVVAALIQIGMWIALLYLEVTE